MATPPKNAKPSPTQDTHKMNIPQFEKAKSWAEWINSPEAEEMRKALHEADIKREEEIQNNPNNGTLGWWRVVGIRHGALVKASSAQEAIDKADEKEAVQADWESPTATFIGTELPDVIEL